MPKDLKSYQGSCHCGQLRFRFQAEEIRSGLRCNCSICRRKGALLSEVYFPLSSFEYLEGLDSLANYLFGDISVNHFFCKTCGIFPFSSAIEQPDRYRINLGCIEGLKIEALPFRWIDGQSY